MSTAKIVLVVLFLLVALGIVGRIDYEDAKRMERANIQDGIRLLCVRFPIDGSAERGPSRAMYLLPAQFSAHGLGEALSRGQLFTRALSR